MNNPMHARSSNTRRYKQDSSASINVWPMPRLRQAGSTKSDASQGLYSGRSLQSCSNAETVPAHSSSMIAINVTGSVSEWAFEKKDNTSALAAGSCDKLLVNYIRNPLYPLIAFMPQLNLLHVFRPPNFFYIVSKEYQQNQNVKMLQ